MFGFRIESFDILKSVRVDKVDLRSLFSKQCSANTVHIMKSKKFFLTESKSNAFAVPILHHSFVKLTPS